MSFAHTYSQKEKLKSRKLIDKLFTSGQVVKAYPFRLHFLVHNEEVSSSLQTGVSVSKRHFKKAVDRNRVKRLMREAYRSSNEKIKKASVLAESNLAIMLIYNSREMPNQNFTSEKVSILLEKLLQKIAD